jgi:hypothetical protein
VADGRALVVKGQNTKGVMDEVARKPGKPGNQLLRIENTKHP